MRWLAGGMWALYFAAGGSAIYGLLSRDGTGVMVWSLVAIWALAMALFMMPEVE